MIARLDIFAKAGYNKNTGKCLLEPSTPLRWKPDGCHKRMTYEAENLILKPASRLLQQTAHFLSFLDFM